MHLTIGGWTICLRGQVALPEAAFVFRSLPVANPDLIVTSFDAVRTVAGQRRFYADRVWELWESADKQHIIFRDEHNDIFASATFTPTWPRTCRLDHATDRDSTALLFEYPLLQLLLMDYLAAHQGALLHACGVLDAERLILLVGPPEAGKSTSARLWHAAGATILSDDRLVLRQQHDQVWAYGTPWHSSTPLVSPQGAPVAAIFLLTHGLENRAVQLAKPSATRRFLPEIYLPLWDPGAVEHVLALTDSIVSTVPCYELTFRPESSVVNYVRTFLDK